MPETGLYSFSYAHMRTCWRANSPSPGVITGYLSLAIAIGVGAPEARADALVTCPPSVAADPGTNTLASACQQQVNWQNGSLFVTSQGTISPGTDPFIAVMIANTTGVSLTNDGSIQGTAISTATPPLNGAAITILSSTLTGSIVNNGTISNVGDGGKGIVLEIDRSLSPPGSASYPVIQGSIINNGTIHVDGGEFNGLPQAISLAGSSFARINSGIVNNGIIESTSTAVTINQLTSQVIARSDAIRLNRNTRIQGGIQNSGTIRSLGWGIENAGLIGSIHNTGVISGLYNAIRIANSSGSIGIITNRGSISSSYGYSIDNTSAQPITTLNNLQGLSGSGGSALTYTGSLPEFYKIIAEGTGYGQLQASSPAAPVSAATMTFGVDPTSSLQATTYTSVISGVSSSLINPTSLNGNFGPYNWSLLQTAPGGETWNLFVSSNAISTGGIYPASNIGINFNPIFAGGTLQMIQANTTYSQNFTVDNQSTSTINQYGNTSIFTGVFSNAAGQTGTLAITNSLTGGSVIFAADNTYTGLM